MQAIKITWTLWVAKGSYAHWYTDEPDWERIAVQATNLTNLKMETFY